MQLVASLVSVLLLVWSVRATALPGEERLALQNTRVSPTHPEQGPGEVGAHGSPGSAKKDNRALPDANNSSTLFIPRHYSFTRC